MRSPYSTEIRIKLDLPNILILNDLDFFPGAHVRAVLREDPRGGVAAEAEGAVRLRQSEEGRDCSCYPKLN